MKENELSDFDKNLLDTIKIFSKEIEKIVYDDKKIPTRIYWTKTGYKIVKSFVEKVGSYDDFMDLIGKPATIYKMAMEMIE
jgi:hypothetical protein